MAPKLVLSASGAPRVCGGDSTGVRALRGEQRVHTLAGEPWGLCSLDTCAL